jgi:hypothetical protein
MDEVSKDVVERALALLMSLTGSRVGAVFSCDGRGEPELVLGTRVDQLALDRVKTAWLYARDTLQCGGLVPGPSGGIVIPILSGRDLLALTYQDERGRCSDVEIATVCGLIRNRLTEEAAPELLPERDEREHLLLLLERNEWNIARVARLLGVSRLTVYRRLSRLGVSRPDGPKRMPGLASATS